MDLNLPSLTTPSLALTPAQPASDRAAIQAAAEGFEEMFLATLLKGARAGLPEGGLTDSQAVRTTTQMLDAQLARLSAGRVGLGLAEAVARQFAGPEPAPEPKPEPKDAP